MTCKYCGHDIPESEVVCPICKAAVERDNHNKKDGSED